MDLDMDPTTSAANWSCGCSYITRQEGYVTSGAPGLCSNQGETGQSTVGRQPQEHVEFALGKFAHLRGGGIKYKICVSFCAQIGQRG